MTITGAPATSLVSGWKAGLGLLVFVIIGFVACRMPDDLDGWNLQVLMTLPIEVPLAALGLLLLPRRMAKVLALLVTLTAFCLVFLKVADIGVLSAFQRRFNPYLDIKMIRDGWNILSGSVGIAGAGGAVALLLVGLAMAISLFWWACICLTRLDVSVRRASVALFATILAGGLLLLAVGSIAGARSFADAEVVPYLGARLSLVASSVADIRAFEGELVKAQTKMPADGSSSRRFEHIKGRDVILVFVESYGRSAVEDPRYAGLIRPRLDDLEQRLRQAGLASASGWAHSPTVGGLSWLAHGTLLSGLWIDSQARYDLLMESDRPSLNRLFHEAGWRTAAVMPAITMDWPEAAYYGYDQILAARDLGYRGKPFNWITMPDQYTLSAFERLARKPANDASRPLMAEIALISSHAPWTPVPKMIDWDTVGDGTAFNEQAESGDPPTVVWADHDRVRRQYVQTIDYALEALGDYMVHDGRDAVFVVLGDHQPAAIVTGPNASRSVPVHIVSRDGALVDRFIADGFSAGMTPSPHGAEPGMDVLRELLIREFSAP
jgi:phosphoglycerol transferase MdoB-like AlkP superfamily enzyme